MCSDHCQHQAAERNHNHGNHLRRDLFKEPFQIYQAESRQNRRKNLSLITDHIYLEISEIPYRNIRCRRGTYRISVKELAGYQSQTENDAQHLGGSHFFRYRPTDAYRQHVEYRFTDKPQEAVHAAPELADVTQCLCAVLKQIHAVDTVAEAKDQTASDNSRNQRCENLRQRSDHPLQHILVLLGRLLHCVFRHSLNTGRCRKVLIKLCYRIADNNLELAGLGKGSLYHLHTFNGLHIGSGRIV